MLGLLIQTLVSRELATIILLECDILLIRLLGHLLGLLLLVDAIEDVLKLLLAKGKKGLLSVGTLNLVISLGSTACQYGVDVKFGSLAIL
jgi:hypothetical protein